MLVEIIRGIAKWKAETIAKKVTEDFAGRVSHAEEVFHIHPYLDWHDTDYRVVVEIEKDLHLTEELIAYAKGAIVGFARADEIEALLNKGNKVESLIAERDRLREFVKDVYPTILGEGFSRTGEGYPEDAQRFYDLSARAEALLEDK